MEIRIKEHQQHTFWLTTELTVQIKIVWSFLITQEKHVSLSATWSYQILTHEEVYWTQLITKDIWNPLDYSSQSEDDIRYLAIKPSIMKNQDTRKTMEILTGSEEHSKLATIFRRTFSDSLSWRVCKEWKYLLMQVFVNRRHRISEEEDAFFWLE